MRELPGRRCQVDEAYSFTYTDDPALGSLTPTLCSHLPNFVVRLLPRPADGAVTAPRAARAFTLCGTHRAIVEAFDRSIRIAGGRPRVTDVQPLPQS